MPEGVRPYPRWEGPMRTGPAVGVVASQEIRRAWNNFWSRLVLTFVAAYTVVYLGSLYTLKGSQGTTVHTVDDLVRFLSQLQWGALAIAAVMAGPSLLEDARRGALELYLSRAVTRADYLAGKILAVFGVATACLFVPGLVYYLMSFVFFDQHPANWNGAVAGALLYALLWGALVAGLGLGLSSVARSSRGATLLLLGGVAGADVVMGKLLSGITNNESLQVLSPINAMTQQASWIFGTAAKFQFPAWWGLLEWLGLVVVGWGLVAWKHPRVRGEERVRA